MKLFTFLLFLFIIVFSSCENHMDIDDVVEGTPTHADTVLYHKFPPFPRDSVKEVNLPKVFQR